VLLRHTTSNGPGGAPGGDVFSIFPQIWREDEPGGQKVPGTPATVQPGTIPTGPPSWRSTGGAANHARRHMGIPINIQRPHRRITMNTRRNNHSTIAVLLAGLVLASSAATAGGQGDQNEQTLYQRLGGLMPISVVVSDFLDKMIPDPQLNENPAIDEARTRVPAPYLKYQVTAFVCQATGGPCEYHGRDMKQSHAHLNITEAEWDRMVEIFQGVLAKHEVPEKERQALLKLLGTTKADIVTGS
jgi:hemoglobin